MGSKIIILELNEVPFSVIDDYAGRHPKSNWARVVKAGARFDTFNPDIGRLHPKTSWQTFHRGVENTVHKIIEYNQSDDEINQKYPNFWQIARDSGKSIGCGASIGSYPVPSTLENVAFYLPDPFSPAYDTYPPYLESFQSLNNVAVAKSGRVVRKGLPIGAVASFMLNLPRMGISLKTLSKVARQLISERKDRKRIVRRRTIQGLMTFDVCLKQIRGSSPDMSTIFSNHVASSMHRYWAASFPDDYEENNMPLWWQEQYSGEIEYAMDEADYMLGELLKYSKQNPEYRIVCLGTMGQAGVAHKVAKNQTIIKDFEKFLKVLGFDPGTYQRKGGMEPLYVIEFPDEAGCGRFVETMSSVKINERAPTTVSRLNENQVRFSIGQTNVPEEISVSVGNRTYQSVDAGIKVEAIQDLASSTAQHVPEGACLVFSGTEDLSSYSGNKMVPLMSVTSSLLDGIGCEVPDYMPEPDLNMVAAIQLK